MAGRVGFLITRATVAISTPSPDLCGIVPPRSRQRPSNTRECQLRMASTRSPIHPPSAARRRVSVKIANNHRRGRPRSRMTLPVRHHSSSAPPRITAATDRSRRRRQKCRAVPRHGGRNRPTALRTRICASQANSSPPPITRLERGNTATRLIDCGRTRRCHIWRGAAGPALAACSVSSDKSVRTKNDRRRHGSPPRDSVRQIREAILGSHG